MVKRGKQRLTPTQRILLWHIVLLTPALGLSLAGSSWYFLSALAAIMVTILTVRRLVVQRTVRIILTRSLEPAMLVGFAIAYLGLSNAIVPLPLWQQTLVLIGVFVLQLRYLLAQFRVQTVHIQSIFSIILIILVNTVWALIATTNGVAGFVGLLVVWIANYVIVHFWLERTGFHNSFLAAVWSIIAVEALWVTSMALVFYTLPGTTLVVSRSALFLVIIAYAWGSMLILHSKRKLSKRLVVEYGTICAFLLLILLVMTGQ
ncbi:MAG: hypothetical protein U0526_04000 [Candidatus Saccharibacteria bacterium]